MKKFKNPFFKKKRIIKNETSHNHLDDEFILIGKLVKEARIKKNISIEELSRISMLPEYIISSIENNIANIRPKYPFIRSILLKLEECLILEQNTLTDLIKKEKKNSKKEKKEFIVRKFDFINTWEGTVIYFLMLILTIFILKKYFFLNVNYIEIQNIEEKIDRK